MSHLATMFRASCVAQYDPLAPADAQVSFMRSQLRHTIADAVDDKATKVENDLYTLRASVEVYILTPDELKAIILANQGRDAMREGFKWYGS